MRSCPRVTSHVLSTCHTSHVLSTCHTSHVLSTCHLTRPRVTGTALALYDKYVELKAIGQGAVDAAIQQLYDIGRETRWEVPD